MVETKLPTLSPKILDSKLVIMVLLDEFPIKLVRKPKDSGFKIEFKTVELFAKPPNTVGIKAEIAFEITDSLYPV